ncbi:MAG: hypothetical protein ACRYGK_10015 [Janthinobacterium lividum]
MISGLGIERTGARPCQVVLVFAHAHNPATAVAKMSDFVAAFAAVFMAVAVANPVASCIAASAVDLAGDCVAGFLARFGTGLPARLAGRPAAKSPAEFAAACTTLRIIFFNVLPTISRPQ